MTFSAPPCTFLEHADILELDAVEGIILCSKDIALA